MYMICGCSCYFCLQPLLVLQRLFSTVKEYTSVSMLGHGRGTIMVDLGNGFKMAQFLSASILCAIWHLLAAIHDKGGGLTLWLMTWIKLVITTLILVVVLSMCSGVSSAIMKIYTSLPSSIYTNLISSCSFLLSATGAKPEEAIGCS